MLPRDHGLDILVCRPPPRPLLHCPQSAVLTDENVRALRGSVTTLCRTLEHVESISSEVGGLARDSGMQRNLRTLITAFSRLVDE